MKIYAAFISGASDRATIQFSFEGGHVREVRLYKGTAVNVVPSERPSEARARGAWPTARPNYVTVPSMHTRAIGLVPATLPPAPPEITTGHTMPTLDHLDV